MKKYFMQGTDDEVQFGDIIELDANIDLENGNVKHRHLECKFIPELVQTLLEEEIIEEREVEDEEDTPDFDCPASEVIDLLNQRVAKLEEQVGILSKAVARLVTEINSPKNA